MQEKMQKTTPQKIIDQYSIRISQRAKYMRLTLSLEKGLVVVVPKSMSQYQAKKMIPSFVKQQQDWICHTIKKLQAKYKLTASIEQCQLPDAISLVALDQVFLINYAPQADQALQLQYEGNKQLIISGCIKNKKTVFNLLQGFFKDYARFYLRQRLDELSDELNLPYNRLTVRSQKTRWGSCSSKNNINLNYRLIFIEKKLLDYVVIHELLHMIHMNHSKAYWAQLEVLMPDARHRDKQLNLVAKKLPCWIFYQ